MLCIVRLLPLVLALFAGAPAHAHDHWINTGGYKSPTGEGCCGPDDCVELPYDQVKVTKQGYVLINGELVPFKEAQESEDGNYWRCKRYDGSRRCFFAPGNGS